MKPIFAFLFEVIATFTICISAFRYLKPYLHRVLVDLCGTEERAQFWTAFSSVILTGLPLLFSLMYHPRQQKAEDLFFELIQRVSGSLFSFMFALIGIGFIVSFFALVAPRARESK